MELAREDFKENYKPEAGGGGGRGRVTRAEKEKRKEVNCGWALLRP